MLRGILRTLLHEYIYHDKDRHSTMLLTLAWFVNHIQNSLHTATLSHFLRLCVRANTTSVCNLCNRQCKDLNVHLVCKCQNIIHIRETFWDFVANNFDIELEVELHDLPTLTLFISLFWCFFSESANDHLFFSKVVCMFKVHRSQIYVSLMFCAL